VVQTLGVLFGGAVLLATPQLSDDVRAEAVGMIDVCLADIRRGEALSLNQHYQELFDLFVEHCGNPHLIRVCRDTSSGLAYKLRLPDSAAIFDWPAMLTPFDALRGAVLQGDAVAAELAGETLHRLHALSGR
jgi:DNA-binding GntR family transcriptional regulator